MKHANLGLTCHKSMTVQIEGAWDIGGRGLSIWDTFTHEGHAYNNETGMLMATTTYDTTCMYGMLGDEAVDFYHRYEEDIALMQAMGIRNFRLSISWYVSP